MSRRGLVAVILLLVALGCGVVLGRWQVQVVAMENGIVAMVRLDRWTGRTWWRAENAKLSLAEALRDERVEGGVRLVGTVGRWEPLR